MLPMQLGNSPSNLLVFISKSLKLMALDKEQRKLKSFAPFPSWFSEMENKFNLFSFSKDGTFPASLEVCEARGDDATLLYGLSTWGQVPQSILYSDGHSLPRASKRIIRLYRSKK